MERNISLDQTALSPEEHNHYKPFINHFTQHTQNRDGKLRFAEAAHFLRKYYPFQTELEDEIRSFFPQEIQLGQIDLGCVLAILRLLSHLMSHKPLHRDLIFIQTKPLPTLALVQQQQQSSNPFLRTKSTEKWNETHPLPPKTSLSADDITKHSTTINSNPFKQRSLSANPNKPHKTTVHDNIPRIPPRPAKPVSSNTHPSDKSLLEALPPPKHYSQRLKEEKDVDDQQSQSLLHVDLPPLWKNPPKPKINSRHQQQPQKLADKSPCPPYSNGAWPIDPQPIPQKASATDHTKTAIPPPLPTKPARPHSQKDNHAVEEVSQKAAMATLTRSQTLNHPPRRIAPALPPPRRRPGSLHIHNPHAVPLDELVASTEPEKGRVGGGEAKGRTVSHQYSAGPQDHLAEDDQQEGRTPTKNGRRSVSLFFDQKSPPQQQQEQPILPHVSQLKSLELGLRNDGKDLLNDIVQGWRARHGLKDERIPLVHNPIPDHDHHHLIHLRNPQLSNLSSPLSHPRTDSPHHQCPLGWTQLD
ncbi:hypothetical protein VP01_207g2 [Puccinia sorghi]|uniref:Uncharacterized protein n=1 Tax=Puccinia sorghi TaxID=27349 RepID=A0A0L6VAM0_9BASI|nr:hypothetical protein VP01_207g2 [Puccinia sorghi]